MTQEQKLDPETKKKVYFGKYVDNEFTNWDWVCRAPTAAELAEEARKAMEAARASGPPPFMQELWIEILIQVTYWAGMGWTPGLYSVGIPVGLVVYGWLQGWAAWNLIEVFVFFVGDFWTWLAGPFRRAAVGAYVIFPLYVFNAGIPLWNIVASFLFLWWALADYYDYQFDPIFGERPELFQYNEEEGDGAAE